MDMLSLEYREGALPGEVVSQHLLVWGLSNWDQGFKEVLSLCQQVPMTQPCTRQGWGTAAHQTTTGTDLGLNPGFLPSSISVT